MRDCLGFCLFLGNEKFGIVWIVFKFIQCLYVCIESVYFESLIKLILPFRTEKTIQLRLAFTDFIFFWVLICEEFFDFLKRARIEKKL